MNNQIKNRWEKIDKELNKFIKNFKYDVKTRINAYIKEFSFDNDNLYDYMKTKELSMLRTELQDIEASDYLQYKINQMLRRTKIKNYEALQLLIELAYFKTFNKGKKFEDELFSATALYTSEIVQYESYRLRPRLRKYHYIPIPLYLLPHIMSTPLYLGYNWLDYKLNMIQYNANKMYRNIFVDLQQDRLDLDRYDRIFDIDYKRYKNALDHEVASIHSEVSLWAMKEQGIKEVQYIAVMDNRTTNICQSMNGQVFKIYDKNVYERYADTRDTKMTTYTTYGLQVGENMPALHYNCRSILIPYK